MIENIKFDLLKMWRNHILRPHTETVQFIEKQPHQLLLNERIRFILRDLIVKQYQLFRKDLTGIGGNRNPRRNGKFHQKLIHSRVVKNDPRMTPRYC